MNTFVDQYIAACHELQLSEAEAQTLWIRLKTQVTSAAQWLRTHSDQSATDAYRATNALGMTELARRIRHEMQPVMTIVVEAKTDKDEVLLADVLKELTDMDHSLQYRYDSRTSGVVLCGIGEVHLDSIVGRLRNDFKIGLNLGPVQPAYLERIARTVKTEGRFVRQTGGTGQYGHVKVLFEPTREGGFEFVNEITGGAIPRQFIKPVEEGLLEGLNRKSMTGFPVSGVKATLYDGSYHDVDSTESAFRNAGVIAAENAARESGLILLEPIMEVHITVPNDSAGNVLGDLTFRRGSVTGVDVLGQDVTVHARVPLREMLGYGSQLPRIAEGRAQWEMSFHSYAQAPQSVAERFIERAGESAGEIA